jgi:hypothetical protein
MWRSLLTVPELPGLPLTGDTDESHIPPRTVAPVVAQPAVDAQQNLREQGEAVRELFPRAKTWLVIRRSCIPSRWPESGLTG